MIDPQRKEPSPAFRQALDAIVRQHRDFLNGWEWRELLEELKRRDALRKDAAQ